MKRFCTFSIFTVIVGAVFCGFWFEVPGYCWWGPDWWMNPHKTVAVFTWIDINILVPATLLVLAGAILNTFLSFVQRRSDNIHIPNTIDATQR